LERGRGGDSENIKTSQPPKLLFSRKPPAARCGAEVLTGLTGFTGFSLWEYEIMRIWDYENMRMPRPPFP
jgi:hypothetical protein